MASKAAVCSGVGGGSGGACGRNVGTGSTISALAEGAAGAAAAELAGRAELAGPAELAGAALAEAAGDVTVTDIPALDAAGAAECAAGVCAETPSANTSEKAVTAAPNHLEDRLAILILLSGAPVTCSAVPARRRRL
jgi:hypothetical protein